jgi:hypothetical protein
VRKPSRTLRFLYATLVQTAVLLCVCLRVDDSPTVVLDCVSAAMWAVNSLGFALVSVAKEVDVTLGSFARTSGEDFPQTGLSMLCLSTLTEVHDFASKLCGLTASVVDTHGLHRFEVRCPYCLGFLAAH